MGVRCRAGRRGAAGGPPRPRRRLRRPSSSGTPSHSPPAGSAARLLRRQSSGRARPPATAHRAAAASAAGADDTEPAFQRLRCALLSLPAHNGFAGRRSGSGAGDARVLGVSWPPRAWTESGEPAPQLLSASDVAAERRDLDAVRGACLSELRGLATSAAHDEGLLLASAAAKAGVGGGGRALGSRHEAAVRCRLEYKLLVEAALEALERYERHLQRSARLAGGR
jgi:hypothetical protein